MDRASSRSERLANFAIAIAALIIAGKAALGWFSEPVHDGPEVTDVPPPSYDSTWRETVKAGLSLGNDSAPVQLMVFTDLECRFCARFHLEILPSVSSQFGDRLNVVIMHVPIPGHRFAIPSATALECAAQHGRQAQFLEALYRQQDSIGLVSWERYAQLAGIDVATGFMECTKGPVPQRVKNGRALAEQAQVNSTPTIMVNGWRFRTVPNKDQLKAVIESILSGRDPDVVHTSSR